MSQTRLAPRLRLANRSSDYGEVLRSLGGPKDGSNGPYRLYKWSGAAADTPVAVQDITNAPTDAAPEALIMYDDTRDVQILFDQGDYSISGTACKDKSASSQFFTDTIVHVP